MTLRTKTLSTIGFTVVVLVIVQFFLVREIVQGGFSKVEKTSLAGFASIEDADTRRNIDRVVDAIGYRIENLATKAADWSQWDDTYRFIADKNRAFVESNLNEDALTALKINFLLLIDSKGNIVYGSGFDFEGEKPVPVPESLKAFLKPGSFLLAHDGPDHLASGLLSLPEGPLMIASRPIVKSNGEGDLRGSVIFARYLDSAELKQLSDITHLKVVLAYPLGKNLPPDFAAVIPELGKERNALVRPLNDELIQGYTFMPDLSGLPSIYLRIDVAREIYQQGLKTGQAIAERGNVISLSLVLSVLGTGLVICLVLGVLIERWVLSRVGKLSRKSAEIGDASDFKARVAVESTDEIGMLAGSINKMLGALEASHSSIEVRNAEMRMLMDTIPAGILSLDDNFLVNPEFSEEARKMFQASQLSGKRFTDLLLLNEAEAKGLEEFFDVMRQELIDAESMAGLNPIPELQLKKEGPPKWIRLRFYLIHRPGLTSHILVVAEDITEEKRLAAQVSKSERENLQLKAIAEDPELFREFLSESGAILRDVQAKAVALDQSEASRELVNDIFRGVHTIKGVSGSFGLMQLAEAAGELESSLEPLRKPGTPITTTLIADTDAKLKALSGCFAEAKSSAGKILGDDAANEGGVFLRISSEEIKRHIKELATLDSAASSAEAALSLLKKEVLERLGHLKSVPAKRGLARSLKIVPGLIDRLAKEVVFTLDGGEIPIDCDIARELNTPLIHMIRNALDHGIEPPENRLDCGKDITGAVTLHVDKDEATLLLTLSDDGKGLDPETLKKSAVSKGLLSEEEAAALSVDDTLGLIFRPGFSTASEVTDVSGRGVGMDAVRASIEENLGGTVKISSLKGKGTTFVIKIPLT